MHIISVGKGGAHHDRGHYVTAAFFSKRSNRS